MDYLLEIFLILIDSTLFILSIIEIFIEKCEHIYFLKNNPFGSKEHNRRIVPSKKHQNQNKCFKGSPTNGEADKIFQHERLNDEDENFYVEGDENIDEVDQIMFDYNMS